MMVRDEVMQRRSASRGIRKQTGAKKVYYPVSYTHLDVYKRQSPYRGGAGGSRNAVQYIRMLRMAGEYGERLAVAHQ